MRTLPCVLFGVAALCSVVILFESKAAFSDDSVAPSAVKLERLGWKQLQQRLSANKDIKFTLVDAWSTTCGPGFAEPRPGRPGQ